MSSSRVRRGSRLRILVAAAWLPYLVLCCCPMSASAFLRCDSTWIAHGSRADAPDAGVDHPDGHCARAAAANDSASHEAPPDDCCSYRDDTDPTPTSAFVLPPPVLGVLWELPVLPHWVGDGRHAAVAVEQHEHSPPIYLSTLTFLL